MSRQKRSKKNNRKSQRRAKREKKINQLIEFQIEEQEVRLMGLDEQKVRENLIDRYENQSNEDINFEVSRMRRNKARRSEIRKKEQEFYKPLRIKTKRNDTLFKGKDVVKLNELAKQELMKPNNRWLWEKGALNSPQDEFISMMEQNGTSNRVAKYILKRAYDGNWEGILT